MIFISIYRADIGGEEVMNMSSIYLTVHRGTQACTASEKRLRCIDLGSTK